MTEKPKHPFKGISGYVKLQRQEALSEVFAEIEKLDLCCCKAKGLDYTECGYMKKQIAKLKKKFGVD